MKTRYSALLFLLFFSNIAQAEFKWRNVYFVPAASLGYSTFDFPKKLDQKITFTNGEFAITTIYQKFILSGSIAGSMANETISEEDDTGNAKRRDIDLVLAYQLKNNINLFAGYKYGRTNISFVNRTTEAETNDMYRQIGPYLGGSYTHAFEKAGKVSLTLAYSYLEALNILHANAEPTTPGDSDACDFVTNPSACDLDDFNGQTEGTTDGLSLGISWNIAITPRLIYRTNFKLNRYTQTLTYRGVSRDGSESFTMLMMGLAYVI